MSSSQRSLSVRSMDSDTSSHVDGNSSALYILGKDIRTAAINNDEETLSILLDGKDKLVREAINEGNSFGRTAVWFASSKNYDKILSLLIRYGADVNKADNAKETPAYIAARYNNAACLSILLKNGANMHLVEKRGEVPYIFSKISHSQCSHDFSKLSSYNQYLTVYYISSIGTNSCGLVLQ